MASRKVSVSLPVELLDLVDREARRLGKSRSEVIADAIKASLASPPPPSRGKGPTVLWRIQAEARFKLRSPRFPSRRIREPWVVEEVE